MQKIIVFTQQQDPTADTLISTMERRGVSALRLDPSDFPLRMSLCGTPHATHWSGRLSTKDWTVDLEAITSIWYRRPTHYQVDPDLPEPYRVFAENEASKGFGGILRSLPCLWVSHPDALREASYKPVQLRVAQALGFTTPRTLITNDPQAFLPFYRECDGNVICKTLHSGFVATGGDEYHPIYTWKVTPEMLHHAENIRHTSHLFQEYVPKALELRVTVIGEQVYAVAIDSQSSERTRVDWRKWYSDLRYSVYTLPDEVRTQCLHLIQAFRLNYGTLDFILTPSGELVYLELNPAGQYMWLERETQLPMTESLIDLLLQGKDDKEKVHAHDIAYA